MTDEQIKHMTERFLTWKLPADFNPDNGISAVRPNYGPNVAWEPVGTNLFDHTQAEAMVRHMVEGLPALRRPSPVAESTPTDATAVEAERDVVCDDWFFRHANRRDPNALINTHPTYFADECAAALTSGKLRARTKES